MGDFVVWATPHQLPAALKNRWQWSDCGRLGVQKSAVWQLGRAQSPGGQLTLAGLPTGTRKKRESLPPDQVADQMLDSLIDRDLAGLDHFLGPVAGVFFDSRTEEILIWRDRFGRLPIQMIRMPRGWVITSCPELPLFLVKARPNWTNLASFIHGEDDRGANDVLTDIYRLRPAEAVRLRRFELQERQLWWEPGPTKSANSQEEIFDILQELGKLYGQRPHILALSAGLDSSTLAAFATARHSASKAVSFYDPKSSRDETNWASQTARWLNLPWAPFCVTEHWPLSRQDDLRTPLAWGPTAHPDAAWKQPFHRWTRSQPGPLPVVYGNGADEVLWFPSQMWLKSRWAEADLPALLKAFPHLPLNYFFRPALSLAIDRTAPTLIRRYLPSREQREPPWRQSHRWIQAHCAPDPLIDTTDPVQAFQQLRARRIQTWGWERIMRSLAAEARIAQRPIWTPFLDAQFWELSLTLRPNQLVEGGRQKAVLRRAGQDLLPEACRLRPKVGGFDPLVERGLAEFGSHIIFALLARPALGSWDAFRRDHFIAAFEAYRRAPATTKNRSYRGSWAIWRTLAAELWLRSLQHDHPLLEEADYEAPG